MFTDLWRPRTVGLLFGGLGVLVTWGGIARGAVPLEPQAVGLALLIGGGAWGVAAWAVAQAWWDVTT